MNNDSLSSEQEKLKSNAFVFLISLGNYPNSLYVKKELQLLFYI